MQGDCRRPFEGRHITDVSSYFVTSAGRDWIGVLDECLQELRDNGCVLDVVSV